VAGLRMTVSGFQRWMLETAAKLSPKSRFSLGDLAGVDEKKIQVTSTTTHGEQMAITPHHISQFSLRLLTEIGRLMDSNAGAAEETKMSTLFLATPNDILSSAEQVRTLFDQVSSRKKTLLWYTRSHHLLLHDVQRQEVCTDLLQWLEKHR
jgi:esterase/lipase